MPSGLRYVVADVFTDKPLGVFLDARSLSSGQMQRLAREMNFAESVFVLPAESGGDARIRIFTPANELPFAGHPVLGSAFVVGELLPSNAVVRLETGVGLIPVELDRKGSQIVFGRMRQPIPSWSVYERQEELFAALGVKGSRLPVEAYKNGPLHVYVALESEEAVASLRPDMSALAELPAIGANCFAGAGRRWKTRMFAPAYGVPEDPAAGSPSARRSRSGRGRKFAGLRSSTHGRRVRRNGSSASRSAARP